MAIQGLNIPSPASTNGILSVSIGGLFCESVSEKYQVNDLYGAVDKSLYRAKENGRNCLVFEVVKQLECLQRLNVNDKTKKQA
ncbi:MAG: hypothetical protein R3254_06460, partial [Thiomicrorhabdus sp.]|nr:hypothetical protein [Thiomicrorhabdus sp.]